MDWTQILIAIIGILGGGFGVKLLDGFFTSKKDLQDERRMLTTDLMARVTRLEDQLADARRELLVFAKEHQDCETRYEELKEKYTQVTVQYTELRKLLVEALPNHPKLNRRSSTGDAPTE